MLAPMTSAFRPGPDVPIPLPPLPAGLDTPALVVYVDRVHENVETLARALAAKGVANRPHTKTHKSVRIARMQLDAGAAGLSVGTIGEAAAEDGGGDHGGCEELLHVRVSPGGGVISVDTTHSAGGM